VSGPDRLRFLNGQVTQDVHLATKERAVYSAVLDAKGRLEAVCHIREQDGSYVIDAPLSLREPLLARLDRYLIADEVELQDESENWHLAHLVGGDPPPGVACWQCRRLEAPGHDVLTPQPVQLAGVAELSLPEFESHRIRHGIPAWDHELSLGVLPPEAGLEASAISYDKGCYLGQEVISRMRRAGKTNQHLVQLEVPAGTCAPCLLIHEGSEAGRVTSVTGLEGGPSPALGFRKRKYAVITQFSLAATDGSPLDGQAFVSSPRTSV
jgi:folate-binding protein YgfZ